MDVDISNNYLMNYKGFLRKLQNFALYLLFFSVPFERWKPFNTNIEFLLTKVTVFFYFFTVLFEFPIFLSFRLNKKLFFPIIVYFLILTVVSYINKNNISSTFFDFLLFFNILLFVLGTNHFRSNPRVVYKCFLAFILSITLLTLFYFLNIEVDNSLDGRISIVGDNQNNIGLNLTCAIFMLMALIFENKFGWGKQRFFLTFFLPGFFFILVITGSRVAFLSSFLGLLAFILLRNSKFTVRRSGVIFFGLMVVLSVFAYLATNPVIAPRLLGAINSGDLGSRDYIWLLITPIILESPLFGIGITGYSSETDILLEGMTSAHNGIIEALCYTGVIGTTFFLIFIFRLWRRAVIAKNQNSEILPIIFFIPIIGILLTGQIFQSKTIWLLLAYIAATGTVKLSVIKNK